MSLNLKTKLEVIRIRSFARNAVVRRRKMSLTPAERIYIANSVVKRPERSRLGYQVFWVVLFGLIGFLIALAVS